MSNTHQKATPTTENLEIETHPFEPWLPKDAHLLILGTFPPAPKRWCMEWYYPNFQNDMWRIFGYIFFGDKMHFDTALRIRRTKNNAADKDLEIVEPSNLDDMLRALPECRGILAAGQLATEVFTKHYGIKAIPKMGEYTEFTFEGRKLKLYRMPSSSRAYPMKLEKKAEYYQKMFEEL